MDPGFNVALGGRLRAARRRRGLSLTEVEVLSDQEFKASVLGAYERGERALSVQRLSRLAGLYEMPVHHLIPPEERIEASDETVSTIDLERIGEMEESVILDRFLSAIHLMRHPDPAGLAVRSSDMTILTSVLDAVDVGPSS